MKGKWHKINMYEKVSYYCNQCHEENPICDKCKTDINDGDYCNHSKGLFLEGDYWHLCKDCMKSLKKLKGK